MNEFEEIESTDSADGIREILYLFWSWAWLIVLVGFLAGMATLVVSLNTTPIYESTTRLLVSDPPALRSIDYSGIVSSQSMTPTYASMLLERPVLQGVIEQLGLSTTPEDLKKTVSVQVVRDTQLLVISVEHPSPTLAADIANTIAKRVYRPHPRVAVGTLCGHAGRPGQTGQRHGGTDRGHQPGHCGRGRPRAEITTRGAPDRIPAPVLQPGDQLRAGAPGRSPDHHQRGRLRARGRHHPPHQPQDNP